MNKSKKKDIVADRQQRQKDLVLSHLRKIPILQIAVERVGIGRTTFYRWCDDDPEFRKASDEAMAEGDKVIDEMTESQLLSLIKKEHFPAVQYRLRTHHPKYAEKLQISGQLTIKQESLTEEQEAIVREALKLVARSKPKTK